MVGGGGELAPDGKGEKPGTQALSPRYCTRTPRRLHFQFYCCRALDYQTSKTPDKCFVVPWEEASGRAGSSARKQC